MIVFSFGMEVKRILFKFVQFLNSRLGSITFSVENNLSSIHFLDVFISKINNKISTTVFRKPTDINTLLSAESHHPLPLRKGLALSQLYRLRRICDSEEEFEKQSINLKNRFCSRGYPQTWFHPAVEKVKNIWEISVIELSKKKKTEETIFSKLYFNLHKKIAIRLNLL